MMPKRQHVGSAMAALLLLCTPGASLAAGPQVTTELGAREIYEGQSVIYRVSVRYSDTAEAPNVAGNDDFDIASLGDQSLSSQRIDIVNGRRSVVSELTHVYNYRLTPKRTGTLTVPAPTVRADGQTVKGRELSLRVQPASAQDLAVLEIKSDRTSVYPTQPFTVTLTVSLKALPSPHAERDPLSVVSTGPRLKIPWITNDPPADAPTPNVEWRAWLSRFQARHGFTIDGVVSDGMFSIFAERGPTFAPSPRRTARRDASGREADYWVYDFPQKFTAGKVGQYSFGPVTLEGTLAAKSDDPPGVAAKQIYAMAKTLVLTVQDVPGEGRPENYVGAIGQFRIEADLVPKKAKVGDPLTLTLTLSGRGSLHGVTPPELAKIPAVGRRFKIYEATQQTDHEVCRFTYSLRPLDEGEEPFPAIEVAYFDPDGGRYVSIASKPVPLTILKADRLSEDQIVATGGTRGRAAKELESRLEGIFANITDPAAAVDESVRPLRWLTGLGGLAGLYGAVVAATAWLRRRRSDPAMVRRRGAVGKARARLHDAQAAAAAGKVLEAANLVQETLVGLVADAANLPAAGLTPKDVAGQLERFGLESELTGRARRLLESCDAARYGALPGPAEDLGREAQTVVDLLIRALKSQKRFR